MHVYRGTPTGAAAGAAKMREVEARRPRFFVRSASINQTDDVANEVTPCGPLG